MVEMPRIDQLSQETSARLEEFRRLKGADQLTPERASRLAHDAAAAFMAHHQAGQDDWADAMTLLCEIATLPDEAVAAAGLNALFSMIVEPLADSFEPQDCALYHAAFAHVVQFCRHLPAGQTLDVQLNQFGLRSERDFLARMQRITKIRKFDLAQAGRVKKALVLSRVTLGADVEITSIIWQKVRRVFPAAEIVLLAGEKAGELFGGDPKLRLYPLQYQRDGRLINRLSSWLSVVRAVDEQCRGLDSSEILVVDPDSRLTQLGLLPVLLDESRYYFFESRSYRRSGISSLGQLTEQWASDVFGEGEPLYPCVHLRPDARAFAEALAGAIRASGGRHLISLNFGVGDNPNKRVPDPFEQQLVLSLLQAGATIILDKGAGAGEVLRAEAIVRAVKQQGKRVIEINEHNAPEILSSDLYADVFTWHGGIGRFSALVAHTDQYIGYDSAGQHIAAALGIPTIVIFAGYSSPLFVQRWRPAGRGVVRCLLVNAQQLEGQADLDQIVNDVIDTLQMIKER
jgi:hypothetical protein